MQMTDALKRAMKGRSGTVERAVDRAVSHLDRYGAALKQRAQTVKEQARTLDPDHTGTTGAPAAPPAHLPGPTPAPPPPGGPSLRGDLVDERSGEGPITGATQPE